MIKKILCILPVITCLYLAPGVLFASDSEVLSQSNITVEAEAYGPAAEAQARLEAASESEQETQEPACGPAQDSDNMEKDGSEKDIQAASDGTEEISAQEEALAQPLSYTEEELYIMAHVLAGECQSCPDQEQLYVGSVVLNRKNHPSFPNTIRGVVFQKGQYSCIRDGNYYREPTQRNWANARTLLESGSVLPANVIWQSGGRQGKGVYVKTKWHYYCY